MNEDLGGLHLKRIYSKPVMTWEGKKLYRGATIQHVLRLTALAPDWTESNVRTYAKALAGGDKERRRNGGKHCRYHRAI